MRSEGSRPEPASRSGRGHEDYEVFDDEVNNRYEEIKRGSTHISELQQMTMPQLIKIAVEGAELQVLQGALETLSQHQPIVVFEHAFAACNAYGPSAPVSDSALSSATRPR